MGGSNNGFTRDASMSQMIKKVSDYMGLDFLTVWEKIPFDLFDLALKESFIDECMQTEEGQKYLNDCYRLKQTKLDIDGFNLLKQKLSS